MQPCGVFNASYAQDMAIVRTRLQWGLLVGLIVFLAVFPFVATGRLIYLANTIGITIIAVLGLNILTGYCGQISLGHMAFVGVGAYASGILVTKAGIPFLPAVVLGGVVAGLVGTVFGLPALRVKGLYLALVSIAAQFILGWIFVNWDSMTGSVNGLRLPSPHLGSLVFRGDVKYYFIVIPAVGVMVWLAKNLMRTQTGRAFIAVRDNDLAAEVMGINLFYYKMLAFFLGNFFAGIAGALQAFYLNVAHPEQFTIMGSIFFLGMLIVGGMGHITGAIFGSIFIRGLEEGVATLGPAVNAALPAIGAQAFAAMTQILFGLVIVLFLILEPRGLAHRWELFKAYYRLHPFSY